MTSSLTPSVRAAIEGMTLFALGASMMLFAFAPDFSHRKHLAWNQDGCLLYWYPEPPYTMRGKPLFCLTFLASVLGEKQI